MGLGKTYSTKYLLDSNNSSGVAGQVLSTTSTGIDWVNANTVPGAGLWIESGNNIYNSNSGNVGIGTTSPNHKLQVEGGSAESIINLTTTGYANGLDIIEGTDGHAAIWLRENSYMHFATNSVERMRITNGGNVGIGTSSPGRKLEVAGDVGIDGYIYHNGDDSRIGFEGNDAIRMYTANSVRLQINSNGNVGIGTTSPLEKLQVAGNVAVYGAIKGYVGSSSNQYLSILQSSSQTFISTGTTGETVYFGIGPVTNVTNISVAGTATATNFILSSDKTLKDNIKDIETKHIDVNWKNFELISEPGVKRSGVIAQELEKTNPEFVRTDKDGLKSVAYIDLLISKIAELEARLEKAGL